MMASFLRAAFHVGWLRFREQPGRLAYLVLTLAVAVLAWNVLAAFASPFLASKIGMAIDANLNVFNAAVQNQPFPLRHVQQIERMPGVTTVEYTTVAVFRCADERTTITNNAIGGSGSHDNLRRRGVSAENIARWNDTRNGLLLGTELAEKCGLTPGMSLSPRDFMSGVEMPVSIVALLPDNDSRTSGMIALGHYEYVNEMIPESKRDLVWNATVYAEDASKLAQLGEAIEREFISADPPLEAKVSSGSDSSLGRFGQVQGLLALMMAAMGACALLVFVTVMAHLLAQRRANMAVLQTIGFDRRVQLMALLLEFSGVMLIGTLLGLAAAAATLAGLAPHISWLFGHIRIPDWALTGLIPALVVLALAALAWPAMQIAKLKPIDYLRM